MTWSDTFLGLLKDNDVRLISYVPDNVLTSLIKGATADNLTVVIWDTGIYEITGKQRAATSGLTDIVAVARGAGIVNSEWVRDEAHFDALLDRRFDAGGPVLLAAKIDDMPGQGQTPRDPALIRSRFMKGLGTGRSGALET